MIEKTAALAVSYGDQKAPEGRTNRDINNPEEAYAREETRSLRGTFARSICRANNFASTKERAACDDGVPCVSLSQCLRQADLTLSYMDERKAMIKKTDETR